ncbi:type IV secretory system conjugative DNA transfer family protein, partial [Stenotrophomonas maltophilia]|uniref:type IV secretory system conjugative DNA transfer family protein n=1 Tax=Stenotrophomonas maltophilia TaxID=40324 RepID=UPI0013DD08CD
GEVMQLPPDVELVLVSGAPPIRAKKVRYFDDPRLSDRVLPPTRSGFVDRESSAPMDDWSGVPALANEIVSKPAFASGPRS